MKRPYQAVFIIPDGAQKLLGENGWEFISSRRLSNDLADCLINVFGLELVETYSGIKKYLGRKMDMLIICDRNDKISSLYLRLYNICPADLVEICHAFRSFNEVEVFIPNIQK